MTCPHCGREVPTGKSWCGSCGGLVEFSARDRERMSVDVRARVLWGDSEESIRAEWLKKGAPAPDIDAEIAEAARERHHHFRLKGLRDVGLGILSLLLAGLAIWAHLWVLRGTLVWIAMLALPVAGLYLTFRGLRRLRSGGVHEGGASDVVE